MKNWNYIEGAKVGNAFSHGDEVLVNSPDWKGMAVVLSQTGSKVRIYSSDGEVVVEEKYVRKVGNQKVGNGLLDMFKKNKTIKMKKDSGEIVTIYSDGESAEQKDERSQMLVHQHNSQKEAVEYYKNKGYKVGNDTPWEYAHRKPKVINEEKTGAEEFFKKLSDDVKEREEKDDADIEKVGNANLETSVEKGKLGLWNWYVHKDGTIVSGGTSSTEANAKEMARKALEKEKVGNFKTGTSQLKPGDKVMSFGKKGTVKEVIGENTDNIYGEPLIKVEFEDGTTKTIGEHYMRKVGNKTTQVAQVGTVKILYDDKDNVYYTNVGGSIFNNPSFKTKEEAVKYTVQKNKTGNKIGNLQYHKVGKISIRLEANDDDWTVYDADGNELKSGKGGLGRAKTWAEHFARFTNKRTGNVKDKNDRDLKVGDIVDVRGKKGKITKIIGDVIEVFYDNRGTYNPDRTDRHYADEATKVGNSKTGNSAYDDGAKKGKEDKRKGKQITAAGFEYHAPGYSSLSFKEKEEYRKGYYSTNDLKKEDIYKWGNSAQDDKFAYVMREFDEGKLKTPDGKVVTDPAQAKAIAYSESKKTENGLARARKAIK